MSTHIMLTEQLQIRNVEIRQRIEIVSILDSCLCPLWRRRIAVAVAPLATSEQPCRFRVPLAPVAPIQLVGNRVKALVSHVWQHDALSHEKNEIEVSVSRNGVTDEQNVFVRQPFMAAIEVVQTTTRRVPRRLDFTVYPSRDGVRNTQQYRYKKHKDHLIREYRRY